MNLYIASNNPKKARDLHVFLERLGLSFINVCSAEELGGMPEVEETQLSFRGNARLKAEALVSKVPEGSWVLGDDSGVLVDALGGAPGLYSKRYAGENATDEDNVQKLLGELDGLPMEERAARFVCSLALMHTSGELYYFWGCSEGCIAFEPSGTQGFGYDPIFIPRGYSETNAVLGDAVRGEIGHRALALKQMAGFLRSRLTQNL